MLPFNSNGRIKGYKVSECEPRKRSLTLLERVSMRGRYPRRVA
jgi:hypothetical protein